MALERLAVLVDEGQAAGEIRSQGRPAKKGSGSAPLPVRKERIAEGRALARTGVEFETVVRQVADEGEAREIARTLNEDRRMLTRKQRLPVVRALKEEGHSNVAIGKALGVTEGTVRLDLKTDEVRRSTNLPAEVTGLDGKTYPASKPKPERRAVLSLRFVAVTT